jgi:hypothetical protein
LLLVAVLALLAFRMAVAAARKPGPPG